MKKTAIILAGGKGARMNSATPKQFLLLDGKPVLYYTIDVFLKAFDDIDIILVLPEEFIDSGKEVIETFFNYDRIELTTGGSNRFYSVQNGLKLIKEEGIVFVHDAVRCLLTVDLIQRCYDAVLTYGSAVPVTSCKDSLRMISLDGNEVINRDLVKFIQTPQVFYSKLLVYAFNVEYKEKFTDEATVVEALGLKVFLVEGEEQNIKISTPADMLFATAILQERLPDS
jgi:2-C-methyl-D-erythritol 4-phosphate cytidylyltransferase